ncbi:hypothetical protein BJV77DRAFT_1056212 [Russula vinacea]|nr:hypothetical protein BJV77DRAFT_1056212 [Russula vinacea]
MAGRCPTTALNCTPGFTWTPNDPLFFLHHAMVDKICFFGGSVQHIETLDAYNQYPNGGPPYLSLNSTMPADGLFPEIAIEDVMNTTGGFLCYVYE